MWSVTFCGPYVQLKLQKSLFIIMGNFVENIILMMKMQLWYNLVVGTHKEGKNKDGKGHSLNTRSQRNIFAKQILYVLLKS